MTKKHHLGLLQEELRNCRTFFDNANDPIVVFDTLGNFVAVNKKLLKISRYSKSHFIGKNVFKSKLLTKRSLVQVLSYHRKLIKGKKIPVFEIEGVRKDGVVIPFEANATAIVHDGKVTATLVILRDLTERKKEEQSLKLYMRGFETSPNSMLVVEYVNKMPKISLVNRGFTRMYGYKASDVVGKNPRFLSSGGAPKSYYKKMWADLLNPKKGYWRDEIINKKKNGKLVDVVLTVSTIFDQNGKPTHFTAHHVDISRVKVAERKLQKLNDELEEKIALRTQELSDRERQFRSIMADVPSVIYRCKNLPGYPMHFVSDAIRDLTGYAPTSFIGKNPKLLGSMIHPDDRDRVWSDTQMSLKKKVPYVLQYRIIDKEGFIRWAHEKGKGIFNEKGKLLFLDGVITDVTSEKEIESAKHEFLSLASHQLRTPLTAINWLTQSVIDHGGLDDFQEEFLRDILKSNQRMVRLVDDLLNVSRLEAGVMKVKSQRTNLAEFLNDIVAEIRLEHNRVIVFESSLDSLKLPIDRTIVRQVFVNILSNALKYSSTKSPITIDLHRKGHYVAVSIKDKGIGIAKRDMQFVFQRFFRSSEAQRIDTKGSGLGLYIVKKLIEACSGHIKVSSKQNRGSIFTMLLPISGPKYSNEKLTSRFTKSV